jgi:hypothetical protein
VVKANRAVFTHHPVMIAFHTALVTTVRPMLAKYPQVETRPPTEEVPLRHVRAHRTRSPLQGRPGSAVECSNCGDIIPQEQIEVFIDWSQF